MSPSFASTRKPFLLAICFMGGFLLSCHPAGAQGSGDKIKELKEKRLALLVKIAEASHKLDPKIFRKHLQTYADVFAARLDLAENKEDRIKICEERILDAKKQESRLAKLFELADPALDITRSDMDRVVVHVLEAQIALEIAKAGNVSLLLPDARRPAAQQPAMLDGIWDGQFVDNDEKAGKGQYHFHEEKNGQFSVTVIWWDDGTKEMELKGERLGSDAIRLTGKYKETTFRYIGSLERNELVLNYRALDAKGKMTSFGVSRLARQAKKAP